MLAFLVRLSARKVSSGFELSVSRSSQVRVQIILPFLVSSPASFSSSSPRSANRHGDVRYIILYREGADSKEGLDYDF